MMELTKKTIKRIRSKYGNWVLITGATSGIGREMALKFGHAGFNLVITGRREHLLNELSTQLFDEHHLEVIPIVGDLSLPADVDALKRDTAHLDIGVVVLNAGFGTSGKFIAASLEKELNMLALNCGAVMSLTHHYVNAMKSRPQKGAIVLLSSMVSFQGVPNAAHYAATKAYVQSFGEALAIELKEEGIDILCAAPGPVETEFSKRADMKMGLSLKPSEVGIPIIKAIGRKTTVLPGFLTKLLVYNLKLAPRWLRVRIMGNIMAGFTKHQV